MHTTEMTPDRPIKDNPRRGAEHEDLANLFVDDHPVGSVLTPDQFDEWAHARRLLYVPMKGTPKNSDAWKAHLQRRYELKRKITSSSTTKRMKTPYVIETVGGANGLWEVRSPQKALSLKEPGRKVDNIVKTQRRQIERLYQSADWSQLPAYEQLFARSLLMGIDTFAATVEAHGQGLDEQFQELRARLTNYQAQGEIKSIDGSIKAIVDNSPVADDDLEPAAI
jgi:hypothetical protein